MAVDARQFQSINVAMALTTSSYFKDYKGEEQLKGKTRASSSNEISAFYSRCVICINSHKVHRE